MKKSYAGLFVAGALLATLAVGCTSKPSAAELKQLEDLKAEVSSLQRELSAKESEKAALMTAIADKNPLRATLFAKFPAQLKKWTGATAPQSVPQELNRSPTEALLGRRRA